MIFMNNAQYKKLFVFSLSSIAVVLSFALTAPNVFAGSSKPEQLDFGFRNDDGSESTATWMAATNTNVTNVALNSKFRLRIATYSNGPSPYSSNAQLEYLLASGNTCSSPGWTKITTSTLNAFALVSSTNFVDKASTTQQISSGAFVAGEILQATNPADSITIPVGDYSEHEYSISATNASYNTAYLFRLSANGSAYPVYNVCPMLTTPSLFGSSGMMSSSNYGIAADSINFGGGNSSSTNYIQESTGGEVATGFSSSTNYSMFAGYQQMNGVVLSVVPPSNVIMTPNIGGITGGTSNGSTTFTVTTDDPAGYSSTIQAPNSPALVNISSSSNSFADYAPGTPSLVLTTATIPNTASAFAFSPQGTDADQRFLNNGATCNTGALSTALTCWDGLTLAPKNIADRTSANSPSGVATTLYFRAISGTHNLQVSGTYVATTTLTVIPL